MTGERSMVVYDCGHTDPIFVHVDNASFKFKAADRGSAATLSSSAVGDRLQKRKKDKKKQMKM